MRRGWGGALGALSLAMLLLSATAPAQGAAPLTATIALDNPPANLTYDGTQPIKLTLQIQNVSGAPLIAVLPTALEDLWRQVTFELQGVGLITNPDLAASHADTPFGTCHYRKQVLVPAIQVVPVQQFGTDFGLRFTFDDARAHFDLTRPGHYIVSAPLSVRTYTTGEVITDCDVEFAGKSLLSICTNTAGQACASPTGQTFDLVSNRVEFFVQPSDSTPPTTTVSATPAANGAGWSNQNVTLVFTATDNAGGSGVKNITVNLFGVQTGTQTIPGAQASVGITTEGITTAFYRAQDNAGNTEKPPTVVCNASPNVLWPPNHTLVTVNATVSVGDALSGPAGFTLVSATSNEPLGAGDIQGFVVGTSATVGQLRADRLGSGNGRVYTLTYRGIDVAGNATLCSTTVTVPHDQGKPAISGAVVGSGVVTSTIRFYDLRFTNTGTDIARKVVVTKFSFPTVEGQGDAEVSYDSSRSPTLPIALGDLAVGASSTLRVYLVVKSGVTRFSITENGNLQDAAGTTSSFSTSQVVSP